MFKIGCRRSCARWWPSGCARLTTPRPHWPPTLARTLRSTNCAESMIEICRHHTRSVKHRRNGQMTLRWCAAGMIQAGNRFRRVNGHLHLQALRTALERQVAAENVTGTTTIAPATPPDDHRPPPKIHEDRDILRGSPRAGFVSLRRLIPLPAPHHEFKCPGREKPDPRGVGRVYTKPLRLRLRNSPAIP